MTTFAIVGGIWLSLLYCATVIPGSVWVIQMTVSRGFKPALVISCGLAAGQMPWAFLASAVLFQFPGLWQDLDLPLRIVGVLFLLWMAYRTARTGDIGTIKLDPAHPSDKLLKTSFWRSLTMPWRFPLWAALILSIGIHLRGPGLTPAIFFTLGTFIGQLLWSAHFVLVAALFGHRVPEEISLRSMNKMRFLATIVLVGLGLVILAPIAFPPI